MESNQNIPRLLISKTHPILFGGRILNEQDVIRKTDRTACVSDLLSFSGGKFYKVEKDVVGKTVEWVCGKEFGDMDRKERLYVRWDENDIIE